MIPPEQAETAALLERLSRNTAIETHISALFIGADAVWKLRKAVRLPYVDFLSVAERHRCALREVELDAPQAEGLYRGVVPVTRDPDGVALDGDGEIIDWVVHMARVPDADFLTAVAARGALDGRLLDAIGDRVAAYHAQLPAAANDSNIAMRNIVLGNGRAALQAGLNPIRVREWLEATLAVLADSADWHARRTRAGFVRRGHGDMQLGNWCLWRGAPVPFDALDFDEELATTDIAYDLAFLLMDLDHRVGRPAANRVMNRVVARTGDWDMARGLRLYLSTRAMIRAHIAAASFEPAQSAAYLDRALACLRALPPAIVAIGGLPGTGKSTLARALAPGLGPAPGALVARSDEIRKRRFGVAPEQRLDAASYAEPVSRAVMAELVAMVTDTVQAGHAVIADATFMDAADRAAIRHAAGSARFIGIWLSAPPAELERRIAARSGDASDAGVEQLRRAAQAGAAAPEWLQIEATNATGALGAVQDAIGRAMTTATLANLEER